MFGCVGVVVYAALTLGSMWLTVQIGRYEELGDFLFEAVFLSQISEEQGHFSIGDAIDAICDKLVFWGSPNRVADQILAFREEIGDFGTLLMAGKDWKDRDLGRRNMQLLAEKVMPQVNAAIGKRQAAE